MIPIIPRQFHFVYGLRPQDRPFPLLHYLCLESCAQVNRPERMFFHCQHLPHGVYWERIRHRLEVRRVAPCPLVSGFRYEDAAIARYRYAHHADFVRLDVLLEHGGVYADIDTLFVHPLPDRLYGHSCVLGREGDVRDTPESPPRPSLCNAFIAAAAGAAFLRHWRAEMAKAFDGTWSRHSTALPWALSRRHPEWVHVEPVRSFYKYLWTREDLGRLLEGREDQEEDVLSIHLWAHLWESRGRRDFSNVHAAQLTERHLRTADTTLARIARRFLPPASFARSSRHAIAWWLAAARIAMRRRRAATAEAEDSA
jgi:hypothetical protein